MAAKDWRSSDRAGRHGPRARSVTDVVVRIQRTLSIACLGESALLFVAGASLVMALIARAGADVAQPGAWVLSLLIGLAAAACWMREHHRGPARIARSLDRRMRHQGSLVTAYEMEAEAQPSALGQLLVRRVLERLRLREALRAMFPSLVIPVAAPLLGLGLLGLSLDDRHEEAQATADISALTEGLVQTLIGLDQASLAAAEQGTIRDDTLREMLSLADRAQSLQRRAGLLSEQPERALAELDSLAQDMADMAARVQGQPELSRPLERAGNWMDAARMELLASPHQPKPELAPKPSPGAPATVTQGPGTGMMSGTASQGAAQGGDGASPGVPNGVPAELAPLPQQPSSGALAGDYWPPEYDGVISGWIELQRRAKESNDR